MLTGLLVEPELLTDSHPFGRNLDQAAPVPQAVQQTELAVLSASVDLEHIAPPGLDPFVDHQEELIAPRPSSRSAGIFEGHVLRSEHLVWVHKPVFCREDPPTIAGPLNVRTASSEEGRNV